MTISIMLKLDLHLSTSQRRRKSQRYLSLILYKITRLTNLLLIIRVMKKFIQREKKEKRRIRRNCNQK